MIIDEEIIYFEDKVLIITKFDNDEEVIVEYTLEEFNNLNN
jgi:hypothetical protein